MRVFGLPAVVRQRSRGRQLPIVRFADCRPTTGVVDHDCVARKTGIFPTAEQFGGRPAVSAQDGVGDLNAAGAAAGLIDQRPRSGLGDVTVLPAIVDEVIVTLLSIPAHTPPPTAGHITATVLPAMVVLVTVTVAL
jgi:hypothetical protein